MQFRLVYEGKLRSNAKPSDKHAIRKELHLQLAELWKNHPALDFYNTSTDWVNFDERDHQAVRDLSRSALRHFQTYKEALAGNFERCGFNFVPLVHNMLNLVCSLDILFLRREAPGHLIQTDNKGGGDIDNRIKTLLDALKMPKELTEIPFTPEAHEKPFFCLMEDDGLITQLNVTTDRLYTPVKNGGSQNDVLLVIDVNMKSTVTTPFNMSLI